LIEVAQIEVAACLAAEPVIEYSMNSVLQGREGNHSRGCLQGVYSAAAEDDWVAVSVRDGTDLTRLGAILSRSDLKWGMAHDEFDAAVAEWARTRTAAEAVDSLRAHQIPAEQVLTAERMYDLPQLAARNFYQEVEHPVTGPHRYPGWPFTVTPGPRRHHRLPPPTLGQHNAEVLHGLGLTDDEIDELRASRVIGETALNT
ncbi:MAG TPA: CoA transferase, partial [Mycobacterium sp.]|nr:CoA transferase [Mycobacterium sp.]